MVRFKLGFVSDNMKAITISILLSLVSVLSHASSYNARSIFTKIKDDLVSKPIISISNPISAKMIIKNSNIVAFEKESVVFQEFPKKQTNSKQPLSIEFAKNIRSGDFYGHYRIIKYKDGSFAALFHLGDFGANQYLPCFCNFKNGKYEISGIIRISDTYSYEGREEERLLVFKMNPQ